MEKLRDDFARETDPAKQKAIAEQVQALDAVNPQIAARFIAPLTGWRHYAPEYATGMRDALQQLQATGTLSHDSFEVVSKSLA